MTRIAIFGDPVLDQVYRVSDPIRTGGKMLGAYAGAVPGGTTANFSCAASTFGLDASFVGRVADNWEGRLHADGLAAFGVATKHLQFVQTERGAHTIIAIDANGEKTLIYVPLAGDAPSDAMVQSALADCDIAYVMAADFARIAGRSGGAEICVDVDAAAGLSLAAFENVRDQADVVFINDVGFQKLTGMLPDLDLLTALMGSRVSLMCCTGGAGTTYVALRCGGGFETYAKPALAAHVVDTTGAGDCFNAAFLAKRATGATLDDVLDFALAAGALATEKLGARDALPTLEAVVARAGQ